MALHTPLNVAESVKISHGSLFEPSGESIELPIIGDETLSHKVSLEVVHNVVMARVEETLMIIAQSIQKSELKDQIGAGIVLTGGFTQLEGLRELSIAIFDNLPVRLARPKKIEGLFDTLRTPAYSAAIGMLEYAAGNYTLYEIDVNKNMRHSNEQIEATQTPGLADISIDKEQKVTEDDVSQDTTSTIVMKKESKKSDQAGFMQVFWNWAKQLF